MGWADEKAKAVAEWGESKMSKPEWIQGGLIGWNEYNPAYHIFYAIDDEVVEGVGIFDDPGVLSLASERLQELFRDRINEKFWTPLYMAVCSMSLPDYNAALIRVKVKVQQMEQAWGRGFIADWYVASGGKIDPNEYIRRRAELGCAVPAAEVQAGLQMLGGALDTSGGGALSPLFPAIPSASWGWVALGTIAIVGTVAAATVLLRPKKTRAIRRRRR